MMKILRMVRVAETTTENRGRTAIVMNRAAHVQLIRKMMITAADVTTTSAHLVMMMTIVIHHLLTGTDHVAVSGKNIRNRAV